MSTKAPKAKAPVAAAPTAATQEQEVAQLTLQDITLVVNLISIISSRGAIKAEEMAIVGALYDKLSAFLAANGVTQAPADAASDAAPVTPAA